MQRSLMRHNASTGLPHSVVGKEFNSFYKNHLAFDLTGAQKRVVKEIWADMKSGKQMNRLLQGDVGSGKTLVAVLCMLLAIGNGYQACLMAPTEILAQQHFETVMDLLRPMNIEVGLLTGSTKAKDRKKTLSSLACGEIKILIGTHALIEDNVRFRNLGLAIIDEQHRFGVAQRAKLWSKNTTPPHVLVMTATPIPRTLAMTLYGDLEVSTIDELPPGRQPIITRFYYNDHRAGIYNEVKKQIAQGRQAYIVYPLIKESEAFDYENLEKGFQKLKEVFPEPQYHISKVHGQLPTAEKEEEMRKFASGETQLLVATTVIEVGVNVPNATIMLIESAERFGLSQLHQLRGRVGRGKNQSYCILIGDREMNTNSLKRMKIMTDTNDGFKISEADLNMRGPGDMEGTQQSGLGIELKIADLSKDGSILEMTRSMARSILEKDINLDLPQNAILKTELSKRAPDYDWGEIS